MQSIYPSFESNHRVFSRIPEIWLLNDQIVWMSLAEFGHFIDICTSFIGLMNHLNILKLFSRQNTSSYISQLRLNRTSHSSVYSSGKVACHRLRCQIIDGGLVTILPWWWLHVFFKVGGSPWVYILRHCISYTSLPHY